jgi:hypothetical protein
MRNKKGLAPAIAIVVAAALGLVLVPLFASGGVISTSWNIGKIIGSIPTPVWIIIGILFLLKMLGGKR